jgi:hypothetical protein
VEIELPEQNQLFVTSLVHRGELLCRTTFNPLLIGLNDWPLKVPVGHFRVQVCFSLIVIPAILQFIAHVSESDRSSLHQLHLREVVSPEQTPPLATYLCIRMVHQPMTSVWSPSPSIPKNRAREIPQSYHTAPGRFFAPLNGLRDIEGLNEILSHQGVLG